MMTAEELWIIVSPTYVLFSLKQVVDEEGAGAGGS